MKYTKIMLLGAASLAAFASAAQAQEVQAVDAPVEQAETTTDAASEMEFLKAQIDALQEQVEGLNKRLATAEPTWKGAPVSADKEAGWSFKLRGRFMYDTAYISTPDNYTNKNLGFSSRVRRVRIGVEGALPGDFNYKAEADFANSSVGFGDVIMTYAPKGKPWSITIGNHESFESLEQVSSSRFLSFIERAQMNDAFSHTRRLGVSVGLQDTANILRFNAGLFTAHTIDASIDNDGWIGAARLTYSPQALGGMLHLGANYEHREFQSNNAGTASTSSGGPSTNQIARYRARPFLQTTDQRFVDTNSFAAKGDDIFGVELGGIFGPLHVVGEAQYVKVKGYAPGDTVGTLDAFTGGPSIVTPDGNPSFYSWYAEVGYYLTGETRGYKNGMWDRTKVLNPFDKGGWGALQINARYDYLDLNSKKLQAGYSNNFTTGVATASTDYRRGGVQEGYQASLVWIPMDYVRFIVQYVHTEVQGGSIAKTVNASALSNSNTGIKKLGFSTDSVAVRAQFDF